MLRMTRSEVVKFVRDNTEKIGEGFTESDDDWTAHLFAYGSEGVHLRADARHVGAGVGCARHVPMAACAGAPRERWTCSRC
jgi:hypothetical protein